MIVRKMDIHIIGFLTLILFFMIPLTMPMASAGNREATLVVEKLQTALLAVMKDGNKLKYTGRYDQLEPVIRTTFDMPFISKTVLSKHWGTSNAGQRSKFVETFTKLGIATYAANFDSYSGERFKVISEKEVSGGRILVQTHLIKSDGGKVQLDYLLHRTESEWRVINVIAEGVSDLALKRADYSNFLNNKSLEALIAKLNEKIAQYAR
ncbi:MAG: toluene tolerance protein [Deltaproteobacteria bacterium]|nr:toluene tolerance protein [Deltaproteobacteria bacterium]